MDERDFRWDYTNVFLRWANPHAATALRIIRVRAGRFLLPGNNPGQFLNCA
jgi:hypothetical protein